MRVIIEKVPQRTDINSTIKPIDREDANAEIEAGEIVFDPEKLTLHKALGKRHNQGGTPVNLNEGAFILSDFNKLALSKKELKSFELKSGGKYSKKKSTPAKILEKNVDLHHHNKLIEILSRDPRLINDATLNSARLMVEKNLEKVGLVSFLQENKKNFTDGPPQFSMGTAPVYSDNMDKRLKQVGQYLKGGKFLQSFQKGKVPGWFKFWTQSNTPEGKISPTGKITTYNPENGNEIYDDYAYWRDVAGRDFNDAKDLQTFAYDYILKRDPFALAAMQAEYGRTAQGLKNPDDITYGFADGIFGARTASILGWDRANRKKPVATNEVKDPTASSTDPAQPGSGKDPGDPKYTLQRTDYNMPFTDWQKMNMAYPFLKAATVKAYMPIRQHQESLIARPELISVQPQLNANNQSAFNASQMARVVSPVQSSSVIGNVLGQNFDVNNQILGNVGNANNQITNTWRAQTAQTLNSDAATNRGFDKLYTDQVNTVLQNRDDMKDYLINQGITNVNSNIAQRESFNQWMNSQDQIQTDEIVGTNPDRTPIFRTRAITEFSPTFAGYRARTPIFNTRALQNYNTGLTNQQQDQVMAKIYENALATIDNPNASDAVKAAAYGFLKGRHLENYNRNRQQNPTLWPQ